MSAKERDTLAAELAREVGLDLELPAVPGGAYAPFFRDGNILYLSGQVPKVGNEVVFTGPVGSAISIDQSKEAARVCALRLLGVLKQACGTLERVESVARLNVFVQSTPGFDKHSEVADSASKVLKDILQCEVMPARTAVGVLSLPRNASVEIDLVAIVRQGGPAR